jgi:hypothetical protein
VTAETMQDIVRLAALTLALALFSFGFYFTGDRDL